MRSRELVTKVTARPTERLKPHASRFSGLVSRAAALGARRAQFRSDPKRLAAWESATNVFGPFTRKQGEAETPVVLPTPATVGMGVQVM